MRVESFPPIIDDRSRVLVLGSMPGAASLRASQYYGNPRNYMWRIVYALVADGRDPEADDYEERLAVALSAGIAMWDTIAACVRPGSLDSDIRDAVPNDVPELLSRYPGVRAIACNGAKSHGELLKHYGDAPELRSRDVLRLPSTSPIPTPRYRGLEERVAAWRALLPYLRRQD